MAENKEEEQYLLDKHSKEAERLALAQEVIVEFMGKAVWAPIDLSQPSLKILDSATGAGVWLRDLEKTLPSESKNTYVGTDMRALFFPEKPSPTTTFSTQDITKPWPEDWKDTFDLVHQRSMLPALGTKRSPPAIQGLVGLLKPGGWIQLVEPDPTIVDGPAGRAFAKLLDEIFVAIDSDVNIARRMEEWLREAGLQNVGCKIFDVPLGVKNPNKEMQLKSARYTLLSLNGMTEVAKNLPVSFSPEALEHLPSQMEEELSSQGGVLRFYCVWGQKPVGS